MYEETIDLSRLPSRGIRLERRINPGAWKMEETDWASRGDLVFDLLIRGNQKKVNIRGNLKAGITANCHRCLKPVPVDFERRFHVTYLAPDQDRFAKDEVEITSQELEVAYLEGKLLSIHDLLQEQIYLAVPMKVLCRPECRGLCVRCGSDLNEVECDCVQEDSDARWAALKAISDKSR